MTKLSSWVYVGFLLIGQGVYAQHPFVTAFRQLDGEAATVQFQNDKDINTQGGHIQGVQWIAPNYFILSGSSSTVSYSATMKSGEVIRVDTLLQFPYKHAGGFQISDGLLAIGVEDNEAKNTSRVLVYDLSDPMNTVSKPLQLIERDGAEKRATAGCVAIAKYQNQHLLLVGDWDTRHLDLYQLPADRIRDTTTSFTLTQSITIEDQPRQGWVEEHWWSYQNVNLFNAEGSLFLVGLGLNDREENVADVFSVEIKPTLKVTKVASQTFPKQAQTSFKWGGGVDWQPETQQMRILTTPYNIGSDNTLVIYD